ncbi:MAG: M1 family metallopeptidase [Ferruginibacter sp.]
MFYKIITVAFLILATSAEGQNLYMPRDVKEAYKNQTRALDGKPGKNYWQNKGRYDIEITVTPPERIFKGNEKITYINNSPDTILNPVLKLISNIHKAGATRFGNASPDYLTDGTTIDEVTADGQKVVFRNPSSHVTWQQFKLPNRLLPHDSVQLTVSWHAELSKQSGREGMLDSTTYFLAYFYPRFAVYDDINGWDRMEFTDAQEFYNDFNDYTLKVNAPKNFIVWSTGTLQNPDEVLTPQYAAKLERSMTSDDIINIATQADINAKNVTAQNAVNTWKWAANDITDMALAISDHYVWDASSVVVDNKTGRRASVQSAYKNSAKDFHYMVSFGRHSLSWLSNNWPGVAFPFPKTTIVQGFADMEYPMMVNDNTTPDTTFSKFVAEHEIAHTWFPFYMGINEHKYGFMDEGWATTFEHLIGIADMGKEKADNFYKQFRVNGWINDKNAEQELPIITPGNVFYGRGLGSNEYGKASLGYLAMKDMLGDDLFRKCLHGFMDRWHGKHPIPWDFFYSFNNISGKNLDWFWNSWYFSHGYIDMAIQSVKGRKVTLQNIGGFPAPLDVIVSFSDGSKETFHQTSAIWESNINAATVTIPGQKKITSVNIDGGIFMDADISNNIWK